MVQIIKMEHCLTRLVNGITIQSTMIDPKITYDMFKQITNNYIFTNKKLKKKRMRGPMMSTWKVICLSRGSSIFISDHIMIIFFTSHDNLLYLSKHLVY